MYLFPLREMLKKIFELPNVYDVIMDYKNNLKNESLVISNFIQCPLWKRKIKKFPNK